MDIAEDCGGSSHRSLRKRSESGFRAMQKLPHGLSRLRSEKRVLEKQDKEWSQWVGEHKEMRDLCSASGFCKCKSNAYTGYTPDHDRIWISRNICRKMG